MKTLLFLFILTITLFSCQNNSPSKQPFSKGISQPKYAKLFHFEQNESGETEIVVNDADTGKEIFRGTPIKTPKTIVLSATHIGMLDRLHALDFITGTPDFSYISNPTILKRKNQLIEIKNENELPLEKIFFSNTNLLIHSAYSTELSQQKLLTDKKITCFPNQDWKEISPLARAEWVKALAFILNLNEQGEKVFQQIEENYLALKDKASKLSLSAPVMSGNVFGDFWYTPAKGSYQTELFKDAHINYVYSEKEGKTTLAYTLEQVLSDNKNTKFWLNPGAVSLQEITSTNPKVSILQAFKSGEIYCYSNNATYYWENSLMHPDRVLNDYIIITHPEQNVLKDTLYFYQKLN